MKIADKIKYNIRRISEYPLVTLDDQKALRPPNQKITPIVYQTWVDNKFGKTHKRSLLKFRNINKNLSFKIFTNPMMEEYMLQKWGNKNIYTIFKNALIGPLKTDIFRYCILYDQGGYYFDISRACKIPLTKLHNKTSKFIITYEDTNCFIPPNNKNVFLLKRPFSHILQWGLAFEKKNKFLELLIKEISKSYPFYKNKIFENPKLAVLNFTGPGMYTKVMRDYLSKCNKNDYKELDTKFNGNGIFKLNGSQVRYHKEPSYTYLKNKKICL
tara:strand:- start:863 stop:1675 length:813 start_codon:yes stop_codon:yes gene_type:complete